MYYVPSPFAAILPKELGSWRPNLYEPACQALTLNHRRHGGQAVPLHQSAGHACRGATLPGGDDDAQAIVPATTHGSAPGIHHKADQEAGVGQDVNEVKRNSLQQLSHENIDTNLEMFADLKQFLDIGLIFPNNINNK